MSVHKLVCACSAVAITATAIGIVFSPPASAKSKIEVYASTPPVRTRLVSYNDLNLTTDAGQITLNTRVRGAVRIVCNDEWQSGPREYFSCRNSAWRGAKPQIERAVKRAQDIAANGKSNIPAVTLAIAGPR